MVPVNRGRNFPPDFKLNKLKNAVCVQPLPQSLVSATSIVSDTTGSTLEAPALVYMRTRVHVLENLRQLILLYLDVTMKSTCSQAVSVAILILPHLKELYLPRSASFPTSFYLGHVVAH